MSTFLDQFTKLKVPNLGLVRFPTVEISHEDRLALGLKDISTNRDVLRHLTWAGIKTRRAQGYFKGFTEEQVIAQLKTEFATFDKTGVHDYLLLVWDYNRWADQQGIVRGWGRGSAASSLTLFALGITHVDPLRHKLNFPRFISEARMKPVVKDGVVWVDGKSAPDIDCDYQYKRRIEVLKYIENKYAGHTCKISTRLELTGKTAFKQALKAYADYSDEDAQRISNYIETKYGKVQDLSEAKEKNTDIKKWIETSKANAEVYSIALALEGLAIGRGLHPSGVFISYDPLDGNIPTELSKEVNSVSSVTTTYDMETVALLGMKVDILGVRTLDLVADTAKEVGIDVLSISVDDQSIYDYLNKPEGNYIGLFQIEEGTTKEAVVKVGPKDIDALSACLAISRPGALKYLDQYAEYSRKGILKEIYPAIDEILKPTGNVLVYQEQITAICHLVFSLSLIDADQVRYAVGKKKKEDMAKWEPTLYANGKVNTIPDNVTKYFWDVCNASADYLFVLAHAVSYAYLTAVTTYLKANHYQAYYLTMLRLAKEEPNALEYMRSIMVEMESRGLRVLPPDILHSESDFSIQTDPDPARGGEKVIRFGLSSIKGVSDKTMEVLASFRRTTFSTKFEVFDAARAAGLDIRVLTSLIYSGCLNWKGSSRVKLALEAQTYNLLTDVQKGKVKQFAVEYNEDIIAILKALPTKMNEKGKPIIASGQLDTLRRKYAPYWEAYQKNAANEELTSYLMERNYLGYSYTTTLFKVFSTKVVGLITLSEIKRRGAAIRALPPLKPGEKYPPKQDSFHVVCFVDWIKGGVSKANGTPYTKLGVTDDGGEATVMLYGEENNTACKSFNGKMPTEGDLVIVTGTLSRDGGMIFATSIIIQDNPVATKKSVSKDVIPV